MAGTLSGIRVIEMAGIGPAPFACMLMSDMGAEVIRIDRTRDDTNGSANTNDIVNRGRKSIAVNLKHPQGKDTLLKLIESADVLIEGFRPGVMEKLGLGPDVCLKRNARLIYGRMTGWGQDGPLSRAAGHDINYVAITGALDAIGRREGGPVPPLNLLGDYGGGATYLVMGVLAALLESKNSGAGQVVDAAIVDGVVSLMAPIQGFQAMGIWDGHRQANLLDGGAHFYDSYECADGRWVTVGSIEPQFYTLLMEKLGVDLGEVGFDQQFEKSLWPYYKQRVADAFRTRSASEWCAIMEGTDVCFAPVLTMEEAPQYAHNRARTNFVSHKGVLQAAPAPRFSRTPSEIQGTPVAAGQDTEAILGSLGIEGAAIAALRDAGAVE